jgi:hypothetical protein
MTRILRILIWMASVTSVVAVGTLGVRTALSSQPASAVETEVLSLAGRLSHPGPLYEEPTLPNPASVMPGLPIATLVLVDTMGRHLWLIRMMTLIALLGVAGIVAAIVHIETGNWTLSLAAPGLMLAGYVALGGQPGMAGPEPLMLALVLAGFLSLRTIPGAWGAAIGALLITVACFTHQRAVGFAAAAMLYLAIEGRSRLTAYALAFGALGGGGYVLVSHVLGPWFNFYAWDVPIRTLEFAPTRLLDFLGRDLIGTLGAMTLAAVLGLALPSQPWRGPGGRCRGRERRAHQRGRPHLDRADGDEERDRAPGGVARIDTPQGRERAVRDAGAPVRGLVRAPLADAPLPRRVVPPHSTSQSSAASASGSGPSRAASPSDAGCVAISAAHDAAAGVWW